MTVNGAVVRPGVVLFLAKRTCAGTIVSDRAGWGDDADAVIGPVTVPQITAQEIRARANTFFM